MYSFEFFEEYFIETAINERINPFYILHAECCCYIFRLYMKGRRTGLAHLFCHTFCRNLQSKRHITMCHIAPFQCFSYYFFFGLGVLEAMTLSNPINQWQMIYRNHKTVGIRGAGSQYFYLMSTFSQLCGVPLGRNACAIVVVIHFNNKKNFHTYSIVFMLFIQPLFLSSKTAAKILLLIVIFHFLIY